MPRNDDVERRLGLIAQKVAADRRTGEVLLAVASGDRSLDYRWGPADRPFFIASATKLYVTALMARLMELGRVDWDAPMASYLPDLDLDGLLVLDGIDHTREITVRHLLAHTSGLADYFEQKRHDGTTTFGRAIEADAGWNLSDVVRWTRDDLTGHFVPGAPGRAFYSDTNYQLLGGIIERQFGAAFGEVVRQEIVEPLGLDRTFCFDASTIHLYDDVCTMRRGATGLRIPQAMASVGADGGIVSTLDDSVRFLRAFMGAELFSARTLKQLQGEWRRIFFPLEYGTGVMSFTVPRVFSPLRRFPRVVGHSGASGTVLFWCPEWDVYVAGTVNQVEKRSLPFQMMIRSLAVVRP